MDYEPPNASIALANDWYLRVMSLQLTRFLEEGANSLLRCLDHGIWKCPEMEWRVKLTLTQM